MARWPIRTGRRTRPAGQALALTADVDLRADLHRRVHPSPVLVLGGPRHPSLLLIPSEPHRPRRDRAMVARSLN